MSIAHYALEDFIQDTKSLMAAEPDVTRLLSRGSTLLERLVRNPDCLPEPLRMPQQSDRGPAHGNYLIYREAAEGEGLCVTAVVWGPGDHAPPHDHHTWGMIGLVENTLQETRFRRLDDGSQGDRAQLELERVGRYKPGEVSLLIPGVDEIHQMDNPTDRPTVEIHVYGRDLAGLKRCRFDPATGTVRQYMLRNYDNA